jgi:hypothetical protein
LERQTDQYILPVVEDVAEMLIAQWQEARQAAIDSERSVRSKIQALTTKGHFSAAERLTMSFREIRQRDREYQIDPARYLDFFERLKSDANAVLQ